jgi:hypothetical protein
MEKRQKLMQRTPSSVTEVVLAQYGDCRDNNEIVWSNYVGYRAYFHGCRIYLRVKSEDKCLTASLVVSGLVWNTKINVGITATATAWIELFGDSRRLWSKQLDDNNEVSWTEDEVKLGVFAVKVAITGFK